MYQKRLAYLLFSDRKEVWQMKEKCQCGGEFEILPEVCGITHTVPACEAFNDIDLDEVIKTPGELAMSLHRLRVKD